MRYRLDVAFHGRDFHGWQRQPGPRTVQGELETWLTCLLGSADPLAVTGAGRTDAGVHAAGMVAHFDSSTPFAPSDLCARLRSALPHDVVVSSITPVRDDFHARYSAMSRTYLYRISTEPSPFDADRAWHVHASLDAALLDSEARDILGEHDFSGFCRAKSRKDNTQCRIVESSWRRQDGTLIYEVQADRFLHEMVRLLVGTIVDVARGRFPAGRAQEILRTGDVTLCGEAAPAHGLTLHRVEYPPDGSTPRDSS
ncbi:MAG: tRNA pseudouridine(38-40) synthase TruA [candidate division Zixibacteria bacterium]|nr:tRNA pseudouridine(38-40) synthase TruA [candidate division Zixibacteria bacterium]